MTVYFSVDVETSGLNVFREDLLSVGVAVVKDLKIKAAKQYNIEYPYIVWDESTQEWWNERPNILGLNRVRLQSKYEVATQLENLVEEFCEKKKDRVFVANPTSFDFPWIQHLFHTTKIENPFSRKHLDLRSMCYGLKHELPWGEDRESWDEFYVKPDVEHFAMDDALAQARTLIKMLEFRNGH